jgi:outer membrane receptor protein involved in Fe transport
MLYLLPALALAASASPAPPAEEDDAAAEIVVVGTRSPRALSDLPTTVLAVSAEELQRSAATTVDGALRLLPSFATLRRSTSLAADPSSQGLNLRGIGPSAVSRTLLLDDGVPANDPFAGWIPWRAIPRLSLARVEVAPGGASALYGSFALGGVVALVPRAIASTGVEVESFGGTGGTYGVAAHGEHRAGALAGALDVEHAGTDGYRVVSPGAAGPIDGLAGARHVTVAARGTADLRGGSRLALGATLFDERQDGGTRFTRAGMRAATARASLAARAGGARLEATAFGGARRFTQERARVSAGRASEALAAAQEVPSLDAGGSLVVALPPAAGHVASLGADLRHVRGESDETLFPPPAPEQGNRAVRREGSGRQWTGGVFVQDAWTPLRDLELAAAVRLDLWRTSDGEVSRVLEDGTASAERFGARTRAVVSPRVAVRWDATDRLTLRASAYRAFRAPTLNELYRPFQVGTVLTASSPRLAAEVLTGAEAGPELLLPFGGRARAALFWSRLDDPMTIVTLAEPLPDGATRQRANLGRVRFLGIEGEARIAPLASLEARLAWTHVAARVTSAPGSEALVGKTLPHDPADRVVAGVAAGRAGRARLAAEWRWLSRAFEDDLNALPLPAYAVLDLRGALPVARALELFAAVENALDRRFLVGRAGVDTVGAPRLVSAGLRLRAPAGRR